MTVQCRLAYLILTIYVWHSYALVQSPPRIVKQPPTDEVLFQNDKPFIIECEAECESNPQYSWTKNGKPFNWQTYDDRISQQPGRGTLVFSFPREEDAGQYQCFAQNELGIAMANSVFVRKAELESFKASQPISFIVNEGEPFKLTCTPPGGWPKPNVRWVIQTTEGSLKSINNSRMTQDPEGNLWFSNVIKSDQTDNFRYTCAAASVFRNEYKLGNRVLLHVVPNDISASQNQHAPIQQYVNRKNEVATLGKKFEMYCIYGGTPVPQIVWSKDGKILQSSDRITQGNYGKSLIIEHVIFEDEGNYICEASNGVGNADSYSFSLTVQAVPYFTVEPQMAIAAEDETVEFRCEASGFPEPEIKWIYNGKSISEAPPNPRRKVSTNSIIIEELVKGDTGNYGCNATNSLGYVYKDVYVNVLALAPEISEPSHDLETVDGATVTLKCSVFGVPKPEVKWTRAGRELTGGRYTLTEYGELQIKDVQVNDAGEYTCYASNKFGSVEESCSLVVIAHPQFEIKLRNQTSRRGDPAVLQCEAKGKKPIGILWNINNKRLESKSADNHYTIHEEILPNGVRSDLIIKSTERSDSALFTCVATNTFGSDDTSINMIVQEVPEVPYALKVLDKSGRSIQLSWAAPYDGNSPIKEFHIEYKPSNVSWEKELDRMRVPGQQTEASVFIISSTTTHHLRILAENEIGISDPSETITIITGEEVQPPQDTTCTTLTSQTIHVSWVSPPLNLANGVITVYKVIYGPSDAWHNEVNKTTKITSSSVTILHGLHKYTNYSMQVLAYTLRGGDGVRSAPIHCQTEEDVPEPPSNVKAVVMSADSILISWKPPTQPNGVVEQYTVYVREQGSEATPRSKKVSGIQMNYEATKLDKNKQYEFWVTASTTIGEGQTSKTVVLSPVNQVPAKIASFDDVFSATYKEDVKLPCLTVGVPQPEITWKIKGNVFQHSDRMRQLPEGSLLITQVTKSDAGEYSCHVENQFGHDSVTHHLIIHALPHAPQVNVIATTINSITLKLRPDPSDTAPPHGYTIHYKLEFGAWEKIVLESPVQMYTLDKLECGSRYQVYVTAFNTIGTGEKSDNLNIRTKGSKPQIPEASRFIEATSNSISLHLSAWNDGGCPMLYFVVEHKKKTQTEWNLVSNNVKPVGKFVVFDLDRATLYNLRVTAHNNAGFSVAEYEFATLTRTGDLLMAQHSTT